MMEALGIHKIHVFPFSVRPGTRAAYMKDHLDPAVKAERVQRLLDLSRQSQQAWLSSWVGQDVDVLIERVTGEGVGKVSRRIFYHCRHPSECWGPYTVWIPAFAGTTD